MKSVSVRFVILLISALGLGANQPGELKIVFTDCPPAVRKTLKREAFGAEIPAVYKEDEGREAVYEVDVVIGGKVYEIRVADDGTLLKKEWEEDDEKVPFAGCPIPVQNAFRKEAFGAPIGTVEKRSVYGRTIYDADAVIDGETYEIKVASAGDLISKILSRRSRQSE